MVKNEGANTMKAITIRITDDEYAHLMDMVGNDLYPDQTIEEFVLEVLADSLPYLRANHWPKNRLEEHDPLQIRPANDGLSH